MKTATNPHRNRGITLVELLITVSILTTLTAVAIYAVTNMNGATQKHKLMADIATLNSALKIYEANGGSLAGVKEPMSAIKRLKTVSSNFKEIAGLRNAMVDPRLDVEWVTRGNEDRAVWDAKKKRFVMDDRGRGVKKFVLNEALSEAAVVEEKRDVKLQLAKNDTWIWDYQDRDNAKTLNAIRPGDGTRPDIGIVASSPGAKPLSPPEISRPGGEYDLSEFDFEVYLRNPNSSTISIIMYSTDSGDWKQYFGEPITISIKSRVSAYVASTEPENWSDSSRIRHRYTFIPIMLELALGFGKSAYNYGELGGAMIPGAYTSVAALPGTASLTNAAAVPDGYLKESTFGIFAKTGSGAEARVILDAAHAGTIPLDLAAFGKNTKISVDAVARSFITELIDSSVQSVTLDIAPIALRAPIVLEQPRPDGLVIYGQHYLVMNLDSAPGDTPKGSRIFFTTDGSDPGYANGLPTSSVAVLYDKPFLIHQPQTVPVTARVYPPKEYANFFTESPASRIAWPAPPRIAYSTAITLP